MPIPEALQPTVAITTEKTAGGIVTEVRRQDRRYPRLLAAAYIIQTALPLAQLVPRRSTVVSRGMLRIWTAMETELLASSVGGRHYPRRVALTVCILLRESPSPVRCQAKIRAGTLLRAQS